MRAAITEPRHDGVLLRVQIGAAYLHMAPRKNPDEFSLSGPAGVAALALGWSLTQALAIYGEVYVGAVQNPTVEYQGQSGTLEASSSVLGIGAGLAYFHMPHNLFGTVTVSASRFRYEIEPLDATITTRWGFGVVLTAGKEWWITPNWAIGGGLQLQYSSVAEKAGADAGPTWDSTWLGLVFSATYN